MKKTMSLLLLGICSMVITGCLDSSPTNTGTPQNTFITPGYLSSEFSEYLQQLPLEQLPQNATERMDDRGISTNVRVFSVVPSDFSGFIGEMTILGNKEYEKQEWEHLFRQYAGGGLANFSAYRYLVMYEGEQMVAFVPEGVTLLKFGERDESGSGHTPFWMRVSFPYSETSGPFQTFQTILYKDFEPVSVWETFNDVDSNEEVMDWIESPQGDLYVRVDRPLEIFLGYYAVGRIEKNGEMMDISNNKSDSYAYFVDLYDISKDGELLYGKYDSLTDESGEDYYFRKTAYTLMLGDKEVFKIDTINNLCYDMYCDGNNYTFTAKINEKGTLLLGKNFGTPLFNEVLELSNDFSDVTKQAIKKKKLTITDFFSLINQKKFEQAYAQVYQPSLSFDEFKQQWQNIDTIHINTLYTTKAFFASYPQTDEDYSDNATFYAEVFVKDVSGKVNYVELNLAATNDQKIVLISQQPSEAHHSESENLIKEYFYLLDDERFADAYALQASSTPSVSQLQSMYQQTSLEVKYVDGCSLAFSGGKAEMDWITVGIGDNSPEWFSLVDVKDSNGVLESYYGIKQIVNGKIKTLSTKKVDADNTYSPIRCGDGLGKPVIYFYPQEETEVHVHLPLQGTFTATYPEISEHNTRDIIAQPDGILVNKADGKEYSYLFREGIGKEKFTITEGFVVKNEDSVAFLQEKLAYLGLTPREYNEFIVYRRPLMKQNKWNLISFIGEAYTRQAPLLITPKPDSMQRVFMVFQGLDEPIDIPEQTLEPFERSGFSVIERGGSSKT